MNKWCLAMNNKIDKKMVKDAIDAFCRATDLKGRYAKGYFIIDYDKQKIKLKVIPATQGVDKVTIGILKQEDNIDNCIVAAHHVYPAQAQLLKKFDIPFIDTAGNVLINKPPLFVFIQGQPPVMDKITTPVRAFKKTGLKLIFAFLCNPGLENQTYREIAGKAGIALGAVGRLMKELENLDFLRKKGRKGFKLANKEELLKRWVVAYPEQLRPGLIVGKYLFPDLRLYVNKKNFDDPDILWGGEIATEKLTGHLIAKNAVVYTNKDIDKLALKLRLQKNTDGNMEILQKFWNFDYINRKQTVPPILIYADLLTTGLERNIEAAGIIYEREIKNLLA